MHYFQAEGLPVVSFNFNQDFSGDVLIGVGVDGERFSVPAGAILQFVAQCYVVPKRESELENATFEELLR